MCLPSKMTYSFLSAAPYITTFSALGAHIICRVVRRAAGKLFQWHLCLFHSLILTLYNQHLPCCWRWSEDRTGEDLLRGEEAVQMPKYCIWCLSCSLFMYPTLSFPRKRAKGNEIQAYVLLALSHSKGNFYEVFWNGEEESDEERQSEGEEIEFVGLHVSVHLSAQL